MEKRGNKREKEEVERQKRPIRKNKYLDVVLLILNIYSQQKSHTYITLQIQAIISDYNNFGIVL